MFKTMKFEMLFWVGVEKHCVQSKDIKILMHNLFTLSTVERRGVVKIALT